MNGYKFYLILTLVIAAAVFILAPIVLRMIQDRDFKRQVEGKKPMRELGENESIPQEEQPINPAAEAEAARARATSMQNLMGPK